MPQTFTRKNEISDVLKWEVDNRFSRDQMEVDNTAGVTDLKFEVGECYVKSTATPLTNSEPAVPAITTVTITKSDDASTANNTFIVGGVTFTAKAEPSEAEGTTEYALDATAAEIAAIVAAKGLTNFTVTADGDKVAYKQTVAGTGDAPTVGSGTDTTVTGAAAATQSYKAAVVGNESSIDFIVLENKTVYKGQTMTVLGLMRGPAIVDISNVICTDKDAMTSQLLTKNIITIYPGPYAVYQET